MAMATTLIAYLPSSSSSAAAAMVGADQEEEEEDNLASLMPNFFKEFVDMNENEDDTDNNSIDVENIRRMEASEDVMKQAHAFKEGSCAGSSAVVKPTSKLLTSYYKRNRKSADGRGYQQSKKAPIFRPDCHSEKENVLSNANLFCKRGILRREGSGRTITRRPFKVDLRNFKSIMNQDAPQDSQTLEDVHAFWVAEDTKEAMMQILKRERVTEKACHQQSAHEKNGNIRTRNACMRRKGSGRRTTFRDFKLELPRYADSLASLDKEQLEEEEDEGPVKSHAFVDDLELQIRNETQMIQTNLNFVQTSQATGLEAKLPDGTNQMSQEEHVMHTMYKQDCHKAVPFNDLGKVVDASLNADAEIVITRGGSPIPSMNEKEIPEFQHFDHVCAERCFSEEVGVDLETVQGPVSSTKVKLHKPVSEDVKITIPCDAKDNPVPASSSAEKSGNSFAVDEAVEIILEDARKVTPFFKNISRNLSTVFTPGTSPTPPSNPLAALGLRKENMSDLIGKRRLHFGSSGKFLLPTQVIKATATSDIVEQSAYLLTFPEIMAGKKKVEVLGSDIEPSIESPSASSTCTSRNLKLKSLQPHYSHHELSGTGSHKRKGTLNFGSSQPRHKDESPKECDQPMISAPCDGVEVPITFGGISEQHIEKIQKVKGTSRKTAKKLRNSLAGSGTRWDGGVRRSNRIKSRPLEFWKGERFLYGRVHQSLTTVVGIKYSCSSLCWQQGEKVPNFKVESFVPDEYAEYVRFAALY